MQAMKVSEIRKILEDAQIQENCFIESDKGRLVRNPIFDKLTKLIIALPYIFDQDHEFPSNLGIDIDISDTMTGSELIDACLKSARALEVNPFNKQPQFALSVLQEKFSEIDKKHREAKEAKQSTDRSEIS